MSDHQERRRDFWERAYFAAFALRGDAESAARDADAAAGAWERAEVKDRACPPDLADAITKALREERRQNNERTRAHARVLESMSAAELSAAGLCMFGMHQRDLGDGWPRATHRVLFGGDPDEIRCCERCARAWASAPHAPQPVTVTPLAAPEAT